jgi:3-deoxy-manno-octulosonate cytidylyltransferase (CMP-KDO synthetase)
VLRFAVPVVFPSELARSLSGARVVVVIPSRFRSTRLPGKPLVLIDGRPMVEHVYRRATQAGSADATVVATDDERVANVVDAAGGIAVMTRADHATGTDRLAEVAAALDCELIVNVQGDEPLMTARAIDEAVRPLLDRPADVMSTLRCRITDPADLDTPSVVKLVVDAEGYALYFSRAAIPYVRPGLPEPPLWRHMGLYVYRRPTLLELARLPQTPLEQAEGLEQLRALEHGIRIATVETNVTTIGVDTPEDLERVRRLFEAGAYP